METSLFSSAAAVASAMAAANGGLPHQHPHLLQNSTSPTPMTSIPSPYSILAAAAASQQPGINVI